MNKNLEPFLELCLLFSDEIKTSIKCSQDLKMLITNLVKCRIEEIDSFAELHNFVRIIYQVSEKHTGKLGKIT